MNTDFMLNDRQSFLAILTILANLFLATVLFSSFTSGGVIYTSDATLPVDVNGSLQLFLATGNQAWNTHVGAGFLDSLSVSRFPLETLRLWILQTLGLEDGSKLIFFICGLYDILGIGLKMHCYYQSSTDSTHGFFRGYNTAIFISYSLMRCRCLL